MLSWECDVYVPENVALLSGGGTRQALQMMQQLAPLAQQFGGDTAGMPAQDEIKSLSKALDALGDVSPVLVGDDEDTDWKVVGSLRKECIAPDTTLDERAVVIGKVRKLVPEGRWHRIMSFPGMNLNREAQRRAEREGPKNDGEEKMFIQGPAVVVDYLAVYS